MTLIYVNKLFMIFSLFKKKKKKKDDYVVIQRKNTFDTK